MRLSGVMVLVRAVPLSRGRSVSRYVGSRDRGRGPGGCLVVWWAGGWCQPVAAGSALRRSNAALSSVTHGHVSCRWSLARRPENASRPATCSSR